MIALHVHTDTHTQYNHNLYLTHNLIKSHIQIVEIPLK